MYGRKPCDVEIRKDKYQAHIRKLEELNQNTLLHRNILKQRKQIDHLIRNSHKIHKSAIQNQLRKKQQLEIQTQRKNYNIIPSIVKKQLSRKILSVPAKHKPDSGFINQANFKLFDKILTVKSQFSFRNAPTVQIHQTARYKPTKWLVEDYSQIYQNSKINLNRKKKIQIKVQKSDQSIQIRLNFINKSILRHRNGNSQYTILVKNGQKQKRSNFYTLNQMIECQVVLEVGCRDMTINFVQRIGQKEMIRFRVELSQSQLRSAQNIKKTGMTKDLLDNRDRVTGQIGVQLKSKKRRNNRQKTTLIQNLLDLGKQNSAPQKLKQ